MDNCPICKSDYESRIKFCRYTPTNSDPIGDISLTDIMDDSDLTAEACQSGCEGTYVEVAKWCHERNRWFRYAFLKCLGGEDGTERDGDTIAKDLADKINRWHGNTNGFVHSFPNWSELEPSTDEIDSLN